MTTEQQKKEKDIEQAVQERDDLFAEVVGPEEVKKMKEDAKNPPPVAPTGNKKP